jgi:hypothetical protein
MKWTTTIGQTAFFHFFPIAMLSVSLIFSPLWNLRIADASKGITPRASRDTQLPPPSTVTGTSAA